MAQIKQKAFHGKPHQGNFGSFFFQKGVEKVNLIRGNGALIVMDGNMQGGYMDGQKRSDIYHGCEGVEKECLTIYDMSYIPPFNDGAG